MARKPAISTARRWSVIEHARNIHKITIDLTHVGDEQRVLCLSDVHYDNPHCDRALLEKLLDEAQAHNAPVIDNGDFYDAMGGKWDPRANKSELRPEFQTARYLDALIDDAAAFLKPWSDILTVRGQGNHETAIKKRHETCLTERLVERLRAGGAESVRLGGYSGFIVFETSVWGRTRPFKLHYHHGPNAGGHVTRGIIGTNRQAVYLADADMVLSGHSHDHWTVPIARIRLNADNNKIEHTRQVHFRAAGLKEEYGDGYAGWHVERGAPPKPTGGVWIIFTVHPGHSGGRSEIDFEIREAR